MPQYVRPSQGGNPCRKQLIHLIGSYSYSPVPHTPGLWCHQWHPITFCLVVDDFGVKYIGKEHADHLIQCLRNHYQELEIDWAGKHFCGINLSWDYTNRTCDLSMPGNVEQALHKFQHPTPTKAQDSPDRTPSITPGAEPPRDAKDSGSARSHSMHLETSSSDRP